MSIPASNIVQVVPSVLSAGLNPLALNGLILSNSPNLPFGAPISFPNLASVLAYFGQYSWTGTATCSGSTLTVVSTTTGVAGAYASLAVGMEIQGLLASGCPPGTYITAMGTYSTVTGTGTVTINTTWTQASAQPLTSYSLEYTMALTYFNGFTLSTMKPTALWFSRYSQVAAPGFFRGASVPAVALWGSAQWTPYSSGSLTMTLNGSAVSVAALNLSSATSPSTAAGLIQTAILANGAPAGSTVVWSSLFNAFVITSGVSSWTGTASFATNVMTIQSTITGTPAIGQVVVAAGVAVGTTIVSGSGPYVLSTTPGTITTEPAAAGTTGPTTVCGGTSAALPLIGLTTGTTSAGNPTPMVPATAMATVILNTQNWCCFTTAFEPVAADKTAFAAWNSGTGGQFVYVPYDSDATITSGNASTTCISYVCRQNSYGGVFPVLHNALGDMSGGSDAAAFVLGFVASINWGMPGGRAAIQAKQGTSITPTVADPISYQNAIANFTNFYGTFATAAAQFNLFTNGWISGAYGWLDSYVGAVWLNAAIQLAEVNNMMLQNTIPYNPAGANMIESAVTCGVGSPVQMALNNGVITKGVILTAAQISAVNSAASVNAQNPTLGVNIAATLPTTGYYFQVGQATPTQRANRTSPPCTLWYMDGGSVNQLNIASIDIQ